MAYESRLIGYPKPFKNKVRTFCQNPGGFVSQENYDNVTVPFNQTVAYAKKVGKLTNMRGEGHILVQRYGDILDGKRTWPKKLLYSNVKPTLSDAEAGGYYSSYALSNHVEYYQLYSNCGSGGTDVCC